VGLRCIRSSLIKRKSIRPLDAGGEQTYIGGARKNPKNAPPFQKEIMMTKPKRKTTKKTIKKSTVKKAPKKAVKPKKDPNVIVGYKTVSLKMMSWHDPKYKFVVGKEHTPKGKSGQAIALGAPCGVGLHFCHKKPSDCLRYTQDEDSYILLEVQANKADILGQDDHKTRVRKLKVNKIIKTVNACGPAYQAAEKEAEQVAKNLFTNKTQASASKVNKLIKDWAKATNRKTVKSYISNSVYEAVHLAERVQVFFGSCDNYLSFPRKSFPYELDAYMMDDVIEDILSSYVICHKTPSKADALTNKLDKAEYAPLFQLLKLGVLPIGLKKTKGATTALLFQPKSNPFSTKLPF
jgi:hypothetical protein